MLIFNVEIDKDNLPVRDIIRFAETQAVTSNVVKEYIVILMLKDENVLSHVCEEKLTVSHSLRKIALNDIKQLMESISPIPHPLKDYLPSTKRVLHFKEYQQSIEEIVSEDDHEKMLERIISHYSVFGGGELSQYTAFRWENGLNGIKAHDDISLNQLYCLERQKRELMENTTSFLQGLPSNNVLLYGNSGCGKSAMVKALLNEYYSHGLRMVEMPSDNLSELPLLINTIKDKNLYYIIFLDDLSFETDDLGYKKLKTILDGGVEKQPQNILYYATSNRFHIINETWEDRQGDDVHVSDTKNEKLSLSERFGIRISFMSPDQNEYLKIVEGILSQKNIAVTPEIEAEAIRWASYYNGKSGRTAAQFVNMIISSKRS